MFKRTAPPLIALMWAMTSLAGPVSAEEIPPVETAPVAVSEAVEPAIIEAAPPVALSTEFVTVILEGEPVEVRARGLGTDTVEFDASSLFQVLNSKFEARESILGYWRFQDGAVIGLDFSDGKVRANGVVLGKLPDFPVRDVADTWLSPNAISVLTGTKAEFDETSGWSFTLDERLKPKFDLDLWVNDAPARTELGFEPRTVGPVLLVPLKPVAEALGHTLTHDKAAGTVTITRVHDSAVLSLELATGLVTVNGTPSGVTPNMSYAEPDDLVLPFGAIETLTGTHIVLAPGSNRVEVTLDDRLSSLALPGERVDDVAESTPFTPEKLDFQLSDRGPVTLDFYSRFQGYNTQSTYESIGGLDSTGGLGPRWMSVDIQALQGWRGTVGDYNGTFRELSGTGAARIRGVSFRKKHNDDTILAIAAGVPLTGATSVGDAGAKPQFGGGAAGVRFIKTDGLSEYGIAAATSPDGNTSRVVAGGRKDFNFANEGNAGFEGAYVSGEIGMFDDAAGTTADMRGRGETRYRVNSQTSVQLVATYDGAKFLGAPVEEVVGLSQSRTPGARTAVNAAIDWRARSDWGALRHVAGGIRTGVTHIGGDLEARTVSTNAALSAQIGDAGPDVSLEAGLAQSEAQGVTTQSQSFAARGLQRFEWGSLTAGYTHSDTDGVVTQRFVATGNLPTYQKSFDDGASVSVGPTASYVWSPADNDARLGASVIANSGQKFGDRLNVRGQVAALSSFDTEKQATNLFASLSATYQIFDSVQLQANYSDDFGNHRDLSVALRGSILFNEPRRHARPKDGSGVLKGRVFFDKNRDGVRQEDEPGIPGVRLNVMNTRLSLNVDGRGGYTIQNIKSGLYTLNIDKRSLPLGMLIAEGDDPRATIGDGRVTTLDIPVMASGQVRGAVFLDENENEQLDTGEQRLEGQWIKLVAANKEIEDVSLQSAAFGQYGFESLSPGDYVLQVKSEGRTISVPVSLTEDELFAVVPIPVPPASAKPQGLGLGLLGTP